MFVASKFILVALDSDKRNEAGKPMVEGGSQDLGQTEIVNKWWAFMTDVMKANPDNSPVKSKLEEVFYLE